MMPSEGEIITLESRPSARARIICFPAAGATGAAFADWPDHVGDIEVATIRRQVEMTEYATLVARVTEAVRASVETVSIPYALFGHSFGGLLAFEVAHQLERLHIQQPLGLLITSTNHPQASHPQLMDPPVQEWTRADWVRYLHHQGGTSWAVLDNQVQLSRLLPRLQADLTMLASYVYVQSKTLDCPIAVFGGLEDEQNPLEQMQQWKAYTHRSFALHIFPGNHFFLHNPVIRPAFLSKLVHEITKWLELKTDAADEKRMPSTEGETYAPSF